MLLKVHNIQIKDKNSCVCIKKILTLLPLRIHMKNKKSELLQTLKIKQ